MKHQLDFRECDCKTNTKIITMIVIQVAAQSNERSVVRRIEVSLDATKIGK